MPGTPLGDANVLQCALNAYLTMPASLSSVSAPAPTIPATVVIAGDVLNPRYAPAVPAPTVPTTTVIAGEVLNTHYAPARPECPAKELQCALNAHFLCLLPSCRPPCWCRRLPFPPL
ncbi:hypothetical protein V8E55_006531 [Tylopilus felleus]